MSEHHRFHAAGHLSAAQQAVRVVEQFVALPKVAAPPQFAEKLAALRKDLALLEQWLVDPLNTTMENERR